METSLAPDGEEYRNSAPVQSFSLGRRVRSHSFTDSSKQKRTDVLRTRQTLPVNSAPIGEEEDIDEEDYEQRAVSQTFACHVVSFVYPNGCQISIVIGDEDQTLRQVREQLNAERSTEGLLFAYRVGAKEFPLSSEQEDTLFKDLLTSTNLRASVRDESLCLYLVSPTKEDCVKSDNELLREYVNVWDLSEREAKDRILLFRQGRVDLYQSEVVLLEMNGQVDVRVRLKDILTLQLLQGEFDTVVVVCRQDLGLPDTAVKFLSEEGCSQFIKYALPYIYGMGQAAGQRVLETRAAPVQATESRHYFVRKVNHYGFKQKRLVWLELQNFKLHISDLSMRNHKVYEMRRLAHFVKRGEQEKKLSILFKEGSGQKDLHLVFSSVEELTEFYTIAENAVTLKQDRKYQIKKTLFFTQQLSSVRKPGKIQRTYSWLSQEATDAVTKMSASEYYFNVATDTFLGHDKKIMVLNPAAEKLSILANDGKTLKTTQISSLADFTHDLEDHRKLRITDDQGAIHTLIFPSVYLKVLFCNVVYSVTHPELARLEPQERAEALKLFVGTWNLGHCGPPESGSFEKWIPQPHSFEVVALGFQECAKSRRAKWLQQLTQYLESYGLRLLAFIPMWEMFLVIFARRDLQVRHLSVLAKPTGIANVIGNKGGCVATFSIKETSFCFVSCHLAAQPYNVQLRNQNAKDLFSMRLDREELDFCAAYDYVFWFGDLNYRIDREFSDAVEILTREGYSELWPEDQLLKEQSANRAFSKFREGALQFQPTYRYIRKENIWSNRRNQTPSWTDRILYRTHKEITLLEYSPALDCFGSDHRPLAAHFIVKISPWYLPKSLPPPGAEPVFAAVEFSSMSLTCEDPIGSTHGQVMFFGQFLQSTPSTPQFGVIAGEVNVSLVEKQLPLLTCAVADPAFLKDQRVVLIMYLSARERTEVIGLASLSLGQLCEKVMQTRPDLDLGSPFTSDDFTEVEADLEFSGRVVGHVRATWNFSLFRKSQQDH